MWRRWRFSISNNVVSGGLNEKSAIWATTWKNSEEGSYAVIWGKDIWVRRNRSPGEEADRFRGRSFVPQSCSFLFLCIPSSLGTESYLFFLYGIYALLNNCNSKILGDWFFLFWLCLVACKILVALPGIKPVSLEVIAQSLNPWTTRKILGELVFI